MLKIALIHKFPGGNEILAELAKISSQLTEMKELIMSTKEQVLADLAAATAAQEKTAAEIEDLKTRFGALQESNTALQAAVASLEEALANADGIPEEVATAAADVKAKAQENDERLADLTAPE